MKLCVKKKKGLHTSLSLYGWEQIPPLPEKMALTDQTSEKLIVENWNSNVLARTV